MNMSALGISMVQKLINFILYEQNICLHFLVSQASLQFAVIVLIVLFMGLGWLLFLFTATIRVYSAWYIGLGSSNCSVL